MNTDHKPDCDLSENFLHDARTLALGAGLAICWLIMNHIYKPAVLVEQESPR